MNILIKLTSIVALIIAPHINEGNVHGKMDASNSGMETVQPEVPRSAIDLKGELRTELPTGFFLTGRNNGIEKGLMAFTQSNAPVDESTWFNFDRLNFVSGSAKIDLDSSKEQLNNIAEILKAYPQLKLKVGGYTDKTGDETANMKLSQDRAESVRSILLEMGVVSDRLVAEGYGPQHPVASNDTEEGRAQNRRIAVRVMEK